MPLLRAAASSLRSLHPDPLLEGEGGSCDRHGIFSGIPFPSCGTLRKIPFAAEKRASRGSEFRGLKEFLEPSLTAVEITIQ